MRKLTLLLILVCLGGTFIFFYSCKKDTTPHPSTDNATVAKVDNWLDEQKKGKLPNRISNIELLKTNLDFSNLRFENSGNGEQLLIIPVNDNFKTTTELDKGDGINLVLFINASGNIRSGNIVLFTPSNGQSNKVPANTFYNIFNTAQPGSDGKFQFLAVSGTPQYVLDYKDKHLVSSGAFQSKENADSLSRSDGTCVSWYLVTSYFNASGKVVQEIWEYLYTTCAGTCGSNKYMSFCAGDAIGGGSGGGSSAASNGCWNAAVKQFKQEVDGAKSTFLPEGTSISNIDDFTKHKNPKWTILSGFGGWHLTSQEIGVIKLISPSTRTWAWQSLEHGGISMVGSTLPTTSVDYNQGIGTPSFTAGNAAGSNIFYAGMSLDFGVTYHLVCSCPNIPIVGWVPPIYITYTSTGLWDANPL